VTPDRVSVLVNVQTRASTAAAAAATNAQRTKAVLDALGSLGLPKDQLSTEGYSAYPEMSYDRTGGTPRVTGYVVTNSVRAESKRVEQAGAIIDAALGAGANLINSLSFYASSIDEPRRQAIALAVAYLWAGTIMIWVLMLVAMVLIVDGLTLLWTRGGGWHDHRQ